MRISDIQLFIEIAGNRSLRKTAEQMFITQQGLSRVINNMEDELGVQLLERTGRGVQLTRCGEAALEYFVRIQDTYGDMLLSLRNESGQSAPLSEFYIYVSPIIAEFIVADITRSLSKKFPFRQFIVREQPPRRLMFNTVYGDNSLAILNTPADEMASCLRTRGEELSFTECFRDDIMLSVAAGFADTHPGPVTQEELTQLPLAVINWDQNANDEMMKRLSPDYINPGIVHNTSSAKLYDAILSGDRRIFGISSPFKEYFQPTPGITLLPIEDTVHLQYGILYAPGCENTDVVSEVIRILRFICRNIKA